VGKEGKKQLCNHNTVGKEPEATLKKTGVVDFQYALVNRLSTVYQRDRHHRSRHCHLATRRCTGLTRSVTLEFRLFCNKTNTKVAGKTWKVRRKGDEGTYSLKEKKGVRD